MAGSSQDDSGGVAAALPSERVNTPRAIVLRTLFVYGPMMAEEALVALLGRVPTKRPATLVGHVRCCKVGHAQQPGVCSTHRSLVRSGYPAVAKSEVHKVEGILLERLRPQEMSIFDYYEDSAYNRQLVKLTAENGFGGHEEVESLCYVWPSSRIDELDMGASWEYPQFRTSNMNAFIQEVIQPCRRRFESEQGALEEVMTAREMQRTDRSQRGS
uniref:Putative gamma-glutamylcyclotransferase n=1 Tax=Haptolina brevifila TaxID=156173 RepID=A0A7S2N3T9_9EUKA